MKLLRRNTTVFEYLPYLGVTERTEGESPNFIHTGEYEHSWGNPVTYRGNISVPSGQAAWEFYGLDTRYTHTLVMGKPNVDIHEGGQVRWNGALYDVIAVRRSINSLSAALKQQTENHAEAPTGGENA